MQVVYVLIALIMFSAFSVEAKTDQSADPNSGTGGTTVTGVTNTTNYEYRAPDLTVTAINGVPTSPSPVTSVPSTPEEKGRGYDTTMRSALKLPPEWFTCKTTSDCTLAHVPCSTSLAIG